MDASIREAKELFVTGHSGGPWIDIVLVVLIMGTSVSIPTLIKSHQFGSSINLLIQFLFVFFIPLLASIFPDVLLILFSLLLLVIMTYYMVYPHFTLFFPSYHFDMSSVLTNQSNAPDTDSPLFSLRGISSAAWQLFLRFQISSISRMRASLFILTAISILAVDFHIFPRSHAKTEYFGTSLMDVGVGAFLFVNAMVHPITRLDPHIRTCITELVSSPSQMISQSQLNSITNKTAITLQQTFSSKSLYRFFISPLRSTLPLIILGILRLVVLECINYQQHVSEYGVHWNFFFTLAAISLISSTLHFIIHVVLTTCFPLDAYLQNLPHNRQHLLNALFRYFRRRTLFIVTFTWLCGCGVLYFYHSLLRSSFPWTDFAFDVSAIDHSTVSQSILTNTIVSTPSSFLSIPNLAAWILYNQQRIGLFAQNKEGICSVMGYTAIAMFAIGLGQLFTYTQLFALLYPFAPSSNSHDFPRPTQSYFSKVCVTIPPDNEHHEYDPNSSTLQTSLSTQLSSCITAARMQFAASVFFSIIFAISCYYVSISSQPISRRLCNPAFCLWILFLCSFLLAICSLPEMFLFVSLPPVLSSTRPSKNVHVPSQHPSSLTILFDQIDIIKCVNQHALRYFVVTNWCTGLVNLSTNTLDTSNVIAFVILCGYLIISFIGATFPLKSISGRFFGASKSSPKIE